MPKQKLTSEKGLEIPQAGANQQRAADDEFWRRTEAYMPKTKQGVFVRLDADVLAWLKAKGKGYQTRMNAMLRVLMESDRTTQGAHPGPGSPVLFDGGAAAAVLEMGDANGSDKTRGASRRAEG